MTMQRILTLPVVRLAVALGLAGLGLTAAPAPASASTVPVSGSGSSWASVAIDQWAQDLRPNGIVVNYNADGSAAGRQSWIQDQYDFAGSDPPFRDGTDVLGGTGREVVPFTYSYVPDTAGGTAFMYHIDVAGHLITNLRLSGGTIMKIFTGQITNWDDPTITKDYGAQLPNLPIIPVIRSDGSGATFFLTRWMAHMFPSDWNAFCQHVHPGIQGNCPQTEFYPQFGNAKAENGSNNVATYITSSFGNGAIGYDEYAYALNSHFPVVKVLNPGGYFVLPSASNVAVALTKAVIDENPKDPNFLQQNLDNVYTYTDPRSYPLSSYSYLIVPRSPKPPLEFATPAGKGLTLTSYINFMLCDGQKQMPQLGYSPLPENLVVGGLQQANQIPGHGTVIGPGSLNQCGNPTMQNGKNVLLANAPYPSPCDKLGAPLNCVVVNGKATAAGGGTSPTTGPSTGPSASANPTTGVGTTGTGIGGPGGTATGGQVTGQVVNLAADQTSKTIFGVLTALGVIAAVALPPAIAGWLRRRRGQAHG
ncbi:MAG TPA: substrate-binding domain-containing protein [Streptosporangiaceae bacterium]|nr:substrate-binding domain-containing protein [Streptosporangiaceae bacterium]